MLGRLAGEMPPPWSRMRIVMLGGWVRSGHGDGDGGGLGGLDLEGGGEEGEKEGSGEGDADADADAAMVTSIGERCSLRFSTVARKAFLRSSVRM